MRQIQMVDTQTQYQKIKNEVDLAIKEVIDSSAFINGKIKQRGECQTKIAELENRAGPA